MEAETRMAVAGGSGKEEMGRCWSRSTKSQLCKMSNSAELMHSTVITVNNVASYTWNLLRELILSVLTIVKVTKHLYEVMGI